MHENGARNPRRTTSARQDPSPRVQGDGAYAPAHPPGLGSMNAPACLHCGDPGPMEPVPAVYRAGRHVLDVRGYAWGPAVSPFTLRARGVRMSPLAASLAPPTVLGLRVVTTSVIGLVLVTGLVVADAVSSRRLGSPAESCISTAGPLLMLVVAAVWLRRRKAGAGGRRTQRALWLWRRCWYCRRCGHVSLMSPATSTALPPTRLADSLRELADGLQWRPVRCTTKGRNAPESKH